MLKQCKNACLNIETTDASLTIKERKQLKVVRSSILEKIKICSIDQ
jgi:hypothetical protein